ncbi:hypothetical protein [Cytobacillus kochii]|uniref:hypothetical protein n=1 Tax=Cytobacillus kochii TaxID=859143 RepID=UPI00203B1445|nr:hypothetical protein [Cytobacillus kochii]MCM3323291.1 hypothetical protein [Cytobacillus kochii]MCM3345686.1 hypothetical protein [Cytobacillus kochii]
MIYKIVYRNDTGVQECIVGAESELEALLLVKKENPIDGKFDVKEVIEISGSGIFSAKTIKSFKRPQEQSYDPRSAYEHFKQEKNSSSYNRYVENLRKLLDEL